MSIGIGLDCTYNSISVNDDDDCSKPGKDKESGERRTRDELLNNENR